MKIHFSHLKNFLIGETDINTVSKLLFQLGHENEIHNDILDIEFTPNKGDCLSVHGLARDLNSVHKTNLDLDYYSGHIVELDFNFINNLPNLCPSISFLKIEINNPPKEYRPYLESYFKDLNNAKNNFFTDISNYLAYEIGQPTHCYEFKKIKDGITLTSIANTSSFKTLLGKEIKLDKNENVFMKDDEIINLAGIMGGETTKCSNSSTSAIIECAFFNPDMIIGKSVKYDLLSEAAYKFERGVDICAQDFALRRFIRIVEDHTEIKSISINHYKKDDYEHKYIINDYDKINKILGTSLESKSIDKILSNLGFEISEEIKIPSWRRDIESINDLAEEVARVIGYNNIPKNNLKVLKTINVRNIASNENLIRNYLIKNGFNEVINDPFVENESRGSISVDNPLDSNRQYLRTNVINSLLKNLDYNEKRQKESIKFFEISNVYNKNNKINSNKYLSIIISGREGLDYKKFNKKLDNKYLSSIIANLGLDASYVKEIDRNLLDSKIRNRIFYIECNVDEIEINNIDFVEEKEFNFKKASSISEFPSSLRDISISVSNENIIEEVISSVFQIKLKNIKDVFIFDYYRNIDKNILKVGLRFIFQSNHKTLEEDDIDHEMFKVFNVLRNYDDVEIPGLNL
ncbi:MAG: phenylalanine--tRNA ligase subunit beta [Gammaproteobacteria bacterium]